MSALYDDIEREVYREPGALTEREVQCESVLQLTEREKCSVRACCTEREVSAWSAGISALRIVSSF